MIYLYMTSSEPDISCHESENYFVDPSTGERVKFACIDDEASVDLTVVVPAYNEQERR